MKIGVIFGGKSFEHEVSVVSATSVIEALDKEKYEIIPIYLDKENNWYQLLDDPRCIKIYELGNIPQNIAAIDNPIKFIKSLDVAFPVMHGETGEDGTIQGFLKMCGVPYVGCGILSSSIAIDKSMTKFILKNCGINVAEGYTVQYKNNELSLINPDFTTSKVSYEKLDELIRENILYPVFIKAAHLGSSVGVYKTYNYQELKENLQDAFKYDEKVLIEQNIVGREIECAVLDGVSLDIGEVLAHGTFYSFISKYKDEESKTIIPADINEKIKEEIKKIAETAFRAIEGSGLSRVDFFLKDKKIILNEINTMPGFTNISMYPKLANLSGISYKKLLDKLISIAK